VICTLLCVHISSVYAQKIETFQTKTGYYSDGIAADAITTTTTQSIIQLADKGFICMGLSSLPSGINTNTKRSTFESWPVVFRLDSLGRTVWVKRYLNIAPGGSNSIGSISPLVRVSDSTFAFDVQTSAGYHTYDHTGAPSGNYLIEIDASGNILWDHTYNNESTGITNQGAIYDYTLLKTPDGGFLIGANLFTGTGANIDVFVILTKTDDSGNVAWSILYSTLDTGSETHYVSVVSKILNAPGGGYLVNGMQRNDSYTWNDNFIFKISNNGTFLWGSNYGQNKNEPLGASDMIEVPGDIYIASPYSYNASISNSSVLSLLKLDTMGHLLWAKGYKKLTGRRDRMLYDSTKKDILLVSDYDSAKTSFLARFDTAGNVRSVHLYDNAYDFHSGTQFTIINRINPDTIFPGENFIQIPNGFAMMFISNDPNSGYYVIKTDTAGNTDKCDSRTIRPAQAPVSFTSTKEDSFVIALNIVADTFKVPSFPLLTGDTLFCDPFIAWFGWKDSCSGLITQFYDSSYFGGKNWLWDFGDSSSGNANSSEIQNPGHYYANPGAYKVRLIAGNGTNKDTITRLVHIAASPSVFNRDTVICGGDSVNLVAATGIHYSWNNAALLADSTKQLAWAYPYQDTTFIATVTNAAGCTIIDSFRVKLTANCTGAARIAGIINQYAAVAAMDTCLNAITVDTASFFKAGDNVMVIEMKGAAIDTSNTSSFGSIKNIGNAGNFEYNTIDSVSGNTVYLGYKLRNSYDVAGAVQLVTIPEYNNVIVTDTLKAQSWNGIKGGILTFNAKGTVILAASINANGQGFRGGSLDSGSIDCKKNDYFYGNASSFGAHIGEDTGWLMVAR